tara:strand:+ start:2103 stop:2705 length:603 start_codon:yes stop_codon:yes gene_type:complete
MSEIRVENIIGETGTDAVKFTKGINATGIVTATSFAGSGAALTGVSAGITVAQQWRLTAQHDIPSSSAFITSNWESVDTDGYGAIGSMAESSGVFTFPLTGIYLIRFNGAHTSTGSIVWSQTEIHTTTDNSNYNVASYGYASFSSNGQWSHSTNEFIFDVTNTSTHKVKFGNRGSNTNSRLYGASDVNQSYATFIRLADT